MDLVTNSVNFLNTQNFTFNSNMCPSLGPYVQELTLPGIQLGEAIAETPFVARKEPGDKLIYSPLGISFTVDEDMKNWLEVYDWITALGFPENFQQYGNFQNAKRINLKSVFDDLTILVNNNQEQPIIRVTFKDAFPISIGDIPLTTSATESAPPVAQADFQYRNYVVERL